MQNVDLLQTQVGTPSSGLDSLANDCLRFTMHFFQPIQQSAQHIYHSALPLSPMSSIFSSMSLPEETRVSDFYGRPDNWGSVVRTIPGGFTWMTTIGQGSTASIAAACEDGTARIYDSVTGVLRLSLRPEFPILEMIGLPDGSLLVCTHSGRPSITLWDIQTGGLVHTFILEREAKRATVSLKGRYLACETSRNTVSFWETASRKQLPDFLGKFEGHVPCWLAPEELIMVMYQGSAYIRNVVTKGPPVHKFEVPGSSHSAVYSQTFDQLVVVPLHTREADSFHSCKEIPLTILDGETGTSSTLFSEGESLPTIAFSQTTNQLVCGGGDPGLETVNISTGQWKHFKFPATAASVSALSNGTVVANFRGSGIQLLRLDQEHASPQRPTPPARTRYPLDGGRIIAIVPTNRGYVRLLESATLSQVLSIPTQIYPPFTTEHEGVVLCGSLEGRFAVSCFRQWDAGWLQMWKFSHQDPQWTERTDALASVGSISPACTRLVTFHNADSGSSIHVRDVHNGRFLAQISIGVPQPLDITFDSEDLFYVYYDVHREPYVINTASRTDHSATHSITRGTKRQLRGQALGECYCLDGGREWVVCGSQRICWVPPGYVGCNYYWVGSSLVMVGQDGTPRKLTFLQPSL